MVGHLLSVIRLGRTPDSAGEANRELPKIHPQLVVKTTSAAELENRLLVNSVGLSAACKQPTWCCPIRAAFSVSRQLRKKANCC